MNAPAASGAPGILRRILSMMYETTLLFAVAFIATWLFQFAAGGVIASGWQRTALQAYLGAVFAAYFMWCWLRGGQTLAMKAWGIRLVVPGKARIPVAAVPTRKARRPKVLFAVNSIATPL